MTLSDFSNNYWIDIIEFLAAEYPTELDFAKRLARTDHSRTWFPSTSHGGLVLSPSLNYEDRLKNPLIAVHGSRDGAGMVSLEVWTRYGDSNSLSRFELPKEEAYERLVSFLKSYDRSREALPE